jgi:hypothetical protein
VIVVFVLFRYALKTIKKAKVKRADYLRREIDLLLTVNHPNIINVVDVFEDKFNLQVYYIRVLVLYILISVRLVRYLMGYSISNCIYIWLYRLSVSSALVVSSSTQSSKSQRVPKVITASMMHLLSFAKFSALSITVTLSMTSSIVI